MGTSGSYGGARAGSALVPTWVDDNSSQADGGSLGPAGGDGATQPPEDGAAGTAPMAPPARTAAPVAGTVGRFTSSRSNLSRYSASGGSDRRSLGRGVAHYVSKAAGGSAQATRRMGASRRTAAGLVQFLADVARNGADQALQALNLPALAGRPIEDVFTGLADVVCPEGGSVDEGIARGAFIETIADLAEAGIANLDGLTPDQMQTVFELYATHTIEARICNDVGNKIISLPSDPKAAQRAQDQLRDFIRRGVSDALSRANINIQTLTPDRVAGFVTEVYQSSFDMLRVMGEAEADE